MVARHTSRITIHYATWTWDLQIDTEGFHPGENPLPRSTEVSDLPFQRKKSWAGWESPYAGALQIMLHCENQRNDSLL